ncbi:MAG TPA: helix-turn-helix domain-containing protein [Caulobacteraceae bacterium]|nr:helix-turn-helix domain-containing protein [Caulobacteraceae bacterium]
MARLIDAAAEVVAEKGFQRASLEEIAARAGLTTGAIYSNFEGKDDLFWAVLGSRRIAAAFVWTAGKPVGENLRQTAESFVAGLANSRSQAGFLAEFILYAFSDAQARERWASWYRRAMESAAEMAADDLRTRSSTDFSVLWTALQAMGLGLFVLHALTPELVPERIAFEAIQLLNPLGDPQRTRT